MPPMGGCMRPLDLLTAVHVCACHVDECGVLVEQAAERLHIVLVPRRSEIGREFTGDCASLAGLHPPKI